jgi:hypothetical protein
LAIAVKPVSLKKWTFVSIQPEPAQAIRNRLDVFGCRALPVRILNTQHEFAAAMMSVQPAKQRRTDAPKVKHASRAGGKSSSNKQLLVFLEKIVWAILPDGPNENSDDLILSTA